MVGEIELVVINTWFCIFEIELVVINMWFCIFRFTVALDVVFSIDGI
jgi:hypothetical protein